MTGWNSSTNPVPLKTDVAKFKEFMSAKYKAKRFAKKADTSSSDSGSEGEEERRR